MPRRRPPRAGAVSDYSPIKILTQIFLLQAAYYTCATVLIVFTSLVAGKRFSPDLVLSWRSLRGDTTVGWTLGLCWMLNSFICVIFILLLVARSKLVLDFALTVHFIHLLVTSLYSRSFPTNLLWWSLQACSAALMTSLGIWSCQWRELRPMNFGVRAKDTPGLPPENTGNAAEEAGVVGFGRGRGKGRGRNGGGEYEMVGMKEPSEEDV